MQTTLKKEITTKPKIAFVGLGWIGRDRFLALMKSDLVECSALCDPCLVDLPEDDPLTDYKLVEEFENLLRDETIDAIAIATPNMLHARQCERALEAGKAVFVQKPLARTAIETYNLIHAAETNNKLLGVDYSYRFTEGIQKIKSLIDAGELGEIFAIETAFHNAYGPDKEWFYDMKRSGGGCLLDLGCHLIDLSLYLLNFPKVSVKYSSRYYKGNLINLGESQVEDFCSAGMRTVRGAAISLACSWNLSAGKDADIYLKIYGTKGSALFENVEGSFYDFRSFLCRGTNKQLLTAPPEKWGGRAITDWAKKLAVDDSFHHGSWQYHQTAELIDEIYGRYI